MSDLKVRYLLSIVVPHMREWQQMQKTYGDLRDIL